MQLLAPPACKPRPGALSFRVYGFLSSFSALYVFIFYRPELEGSLLHRKRALPPSLPSFIEPESYRPRIAIVMWNTRQCFIAPVAVLPILSSSVNSLITPYRARAYFHFSSRGSCDFHLPS